MKKISIITVVRNAAAELETTLTNLESLDYPNLEIVVIDGASTDATTEVIAKHRSRIAYTVSEPDKGLYDAMNKGISAATGDYIWFINAGDKVFERETLKNIFSENNDADIYFGETMICSEKGDRLGLLKKRVPKILTWKSLKRGMVVCHQSIIVKLEIAPQYDLQYRYVSDIDWVIKCLKAAKKVQNTGAILSEFAEGGISTTQRKASLRERWKVMKKHYGICATLFAHIRFLIETPFNKHYRKP